MSCAGVLTIPSDYADLKKPTLIIMTVYSSNNHMELFIVL